MSFFTGAMGFDLGLEKAGFEIISACENNRWCRETIKANRPDLPLFGDIVELSKTKIQDSLGSRFPKQLDVVFGGPPCQAFSVAGKRRGFSDDRGNLFLRYIDLAVELSPKFILIENVKGLLSARCEPPSEEGFMEPINSDQLPGSALKKIVLRLEQARYGVSYKVYNSADFGTPQKRERVIMICSKDGRRIPHLRPTHSENGKYGLKKWRTLRDAIGDLNEENPEFTEYSEKRLRYFKMLKAGQNWQSLPPYLHEEALGKCYYLPGGKTGQYQRLSWDKPCPTLLTSPTMPITSRCHPDQDRPLSIAEYKRIQEFPDDWILKGSTTEKYRQVGNAVPIGLGEAFRLKA